jgi:O-antigen/teichoic acid export membrane protein
MIKKILSYGGVEAFTKGLNKLLILLLPFFLSTEDYGKIGIIISVELLLPMITLLGFERAVLRFYNNTKEPVISFSATIFESIKYTHLLLISIFGFAYVCGIISFLGIEIFPDLILVVILVYLQCYNRIILFMFRVDDQHKLYCRAKVFLQIGKFVLILILVYFMQNYIAYLIASLIISLLINLYFKKNSIANESFDLKTFKHLFYFSWPFIFHGISMNLLGNADKFILMKYLGFYEVGQYTFIYSFATIIFFAFIGISVFIEPLIYKAEDEKIRDILLNKFLIYSLITGFLFFNVVGILNLTLIPYLYGVKYGSALEYIPLITMSYLLYPFYLASNYKMIYAKKTKLIAIISIMSSIFAIGLNFIFIPQLGLFGAVVVNFLSYSIQIIGFILIANKFKMKKEALEVFLVSILLSVFLIFRLPFYFTSLLMLAYILYLLFNKGFVKLIKI